MAHRNEEPTKLCFVISPIGAPGGPERIHADWLLKGIIEPVFADHFVGFRVERADKINVPGMIDSQVINRLLDAELVIADMSFLNANAFYEMGIRHMKQRPIIHMYRAGHTIPFDVAPHRAIPFEYAHPDDLKHAQAALKAAVEEVQKPDFQVENPVTRARGFVALEEGATSGEKVLLEQVQTLQARVTMLERDRNARTHQPKFYGGELTPSPRTLVRFSTKRGLSAEQADIIQRALTKTFNAAVLLSQGSTEILFAVPGDFNINDFEIPGGLPKGLDISVLLPYPGSP
jgi:hypothetical protein